LRPQKKFSKKLQRFLSVLQNEAIMQKGYFAVALTGGSSPEGLYRLLSEDQYKNQIDWTKVLIFWGDERWVPLDNDLSNARMSYEQLLDRVPVRPVNVFPMYRDGITAEDFAAVYNVLLKEMLGCDGRMDLILLGMGQDGHTASCFREPWRWMKKKIGSLRIIWNSSRCIGLH
jgi:6-phosphogluconolactonase